MPWLLAGGMRHITHWYHTVKLRNILINILMGIVLSSHLSLLFVLFLHVYAVRSSAALLCSETKTVGCIVAYSKGEVKVFTLLSFELGSNNGNIMRNKKG